MFKKISVAGVLIAVVMVSHIPFSYGMDREENPRSSTMSRKERKAMEKAQWKALGRSLAGAFLSAPESQQILGPQLNAHFQGKWEHSLAHDAERTFNQQNFGYYLHDRELANHAAQESDYGLLKLAASDPLLKNRLVIKRQDLEPQINEFEKAYNNEHYGLPLTNAGLAIQAALESNDEALVAVAAIDARLKKILIAENPKLEDKINAWK